MAKSTTIDISTDLLKQVPGIKFGPNAITWQALVTAFAAASESFEYQSEWHPMSPLTLVASELGSLLNLQDKEMINLLIELWDGKRSYEKITKMSGNDVVEAPWINLQAGTTPHWIADNMPQAMIGGGLSSRCLFVYGDTKERYVAYVDEQVTKGDDSFKQMLIQDLEQIAMLTGPYTISPEARAWGKDWYKNFWETASSRMDDQMLEGYAARKQTHMHKVAMVLSASRGSSLRIESEDLQLANTMLEDLEQDMPRVFSRIGRTEDSMQAERFIEFVKRKGSVPYHDAYKMIHLYFPDFRDFEGILHGCLNSGQLRMVSTAQGMMLQATGPASPATPPQSPPKGLIITPDTVM
ncbi:MAG: DUF3987 domain-containing protein [Ilumatobacteraceae bacterium]|nr:DUF3987 domain-containing protein [Ilumatobacteraceae bacterium]